MRGRPRDTDGWVVPADSSLVIRAVEVRALVLHFGYTVHDVEPMGKPRRDVELAAVLGGERHAHPTTERARAPPDVHCHVEHGPRNYPHQFALRLEKLIMQATECIRPRAGVVVLDKPRGDPGIGVLSRVVALEDKPPRVVKDRGLNDEHSWHLCPCDVHVNWCAASRPSGSRITRSRYWPYALLPNPAARRSSWAVSMNFMR